MLIEGILALGLIGFIVRPLPEAFTYWTDRNYHNEDLQQANRLQALSLVASTNQREHHLSLNGMRLGGDDDEYFPMGGLIVKTTDIVGTNLRYGDLQKSCFGNVQGDSRTNLSHVKGLGSSFSPGSNLQDANLEKIDLSGALLGWIVVPPPDYVPPLCCIESIIGGPIDVPEQIGTTPAAGVAAGSTIMRVSWPPNSRCAEGCNEDIPTTCGVNLSGSKLQKAKLHDTQLPGVDLSNAHLEGAEFISAYLVVANLQNAIFDKTTDFSEVDVEGAKFSTDGIAPAKTRCINGDPIGYPGPLPQQCPKKKS